MKPHICLIPGFDGTGLLFEPLIKELNPEFRITVTTHSAPENFGAVVTEIENQLPKDEEIFLFAESYGGPIAIELLSSNKFKVSGAILCATFAETPYSILVGLSKFLPNSVLDSNIVKRLVFDIFGIEGSMYAETREIANQVLRKESSETIRKKLNVLKSTRLYEKAEDISVPVLYIRGSRDRIVSKKLGDKLLSRIENAEMTELSSPHLVVQSVPVESANLISSFVTTNKKPNRTATPPIG